MPASVVSVGLGVVMEIAQVLEQVRQIDHLTWEIFMAACRLPKIAFVCTLIVSVSILSVGAPVLPFLMVDWLRKKWQKQLNRWDKH